MTQSGRLTGRARERLMDLSRQEMRISERARELGKNQPDADDREGQAAFRRQLVALTEERLPILEEMAEIAPDAVTITRNAAGWVMSTRVSNERIYEYTGEWPQI